MPTEPDEGYLDDEFAKFRAARLKKGAAPLEPHATATQTPPRTTRPPPPPLPTRESHAPAAPVTPPAKDEHPTGSGRRLEVLEEPGPGDDFERFRAQRLRETGKLQKQAEPEVALEPTTLPAPEPAKDAEAQDPATRPTVRLPAEAPEDGLFFGTSTTERLQIRAVAREARADGDVPPPKGDEAA